MGQLKSALKLEPNLKRSSLTSEAVDSPTKQKANKMSKIIEEHELENLASSNSSKGSGKKKKDKRQSKVSFVEESLESSSTDKKKSSISSKTSDSDLKIKLVDNSQARQKDTTIVDTNTFMSSAFQESSESAIPLVG